MDILVKKLSFFTEENVIQLDSKILIKMKLSY